ncbi:4-alpha-glucanotransferase [Basfia succiniciproducens]|uniref:4-alpha-glucanotransferase n=1 Tax=Basfia succiniciproducens TaxID=653940 RepID=A0A1G5ACF3_9PAST|nr:4-alpha-glucanotransferase [Basfia succiniciproducens]QIM68499.1 4-alpha-glucanotransferase [Basfia succiniciproducens]SCX75586.1 4-alpha-glucanotransferase [Basfia succiniciproducens]
MSELQQAAQLGIALSYYDIEGRLIQAKEETLQYFTALFQPPPDGKNKSTKQFHDVFVMNAQERAIYEFQRLALSPPVCEYQLFDEQNKLCGEQTLSDPKSLSLPPLEAGYYLLKLKCNDAEYRIRLLVQPSTAYQPPLLERKKAWGLNVQLYSLRSTRNWGIGDFADLRNLIKSAVKFGADFIGINPLHLVYPAVPEWASPYSSSSRRWLNCIYLDIESLPEYTLSKLAKKWRVEHNEQIEQLRKAELVDYATVNQLKQSALALLFDFFNRSKSAQIAARRTEFNVFVENQGEALLYQGLFNVLDSIEHVDLPENENQIGWLGWRKEWQHLTSKKRKALLKEHQKQVYFYAWQQWLAEQQLAETESLCLTEGMQLGIYGDLAVNSSRGSSDVWSDQKLYCINASVGAPPDPLGPVGQNWNLPPYNPNQLKRRGFQPVIDMLRANMRHFGVLRIDHVMGLFRLWLIPEGKTAADGVYVHYPFNELMAILAIESQRNQCLIIGEDLGTVPDEVRSKLKEFQILSYFVVYFSNQNGEFPQGKDFPVNAFATIGTHDVPSLAGFWHCRDLALFAQLDVLKDDLLKAKYDQRLTDKQALLDRLRLDGYLPADYQGDALNMAMHDNLNLVIHRYLAESASQLVGVQLENLLNQEVSFNLPGTSTEYPNWRKKLTVNLDDIFNDERIIALLKTINYARSQPKS